MTLPPDHDAPVETMWEGRYIVAKKRGRWEYVARARGIRAAVILAVEDGHVLLVEQYRVPLGRACLELPAGLIGDETAGEDALASAARELEEETGWRPAHVESLGQFHSSPGMVSESFTLVRATGLTRVSDGGGVAGEGITPYRVALDALPAFIAARRAAGVAVDVRLMLLLADALLPPP
ncbi:MULTISPECIES: NUDIX hydrolase [unclassified Sphingomonas]|jgi:ADP-ribose pyrophosphatase|uniref:NUDIX hydrolase n=1 Tax=unclassified Sphingomonas TaxID=196159 RepID=UPI000830D512|nr:MULTISPECIES: NUDIX hydrolase [unclassified Sphingomonas]